MHFAVDKLHDVNTGTLLFIAKIHYFAKQMNQLHFEIRMVEKRRSREENIYLPWARPANSHVGLLKNRN